MALWKSRKTAELEAALAEARHVARELAKAKSKQDETIRLKNHELREVYSALGDTQYRYREVLKRCHYRDPATGRIGAMGQAPDPFARKAN